jgi:D-amino-acid dehydrogenase
VLIVKRDRPTSAIVAGGGVVGLCIARELVLGGMEVTVVEAGRCGSGASHGNAGWVTPSLSAPLAAPGALRSALAWMLRPGSPFRLRPRADLGDLAWYWDFQRNCSPSRFRAGLAAVLALNASTFADYDRLQADGVVFEMHETGLVFAARTRHGLDHSRQLRSQLIGAGCAGIGDLLDGDSVRALEPALARTVCGGFVAGHERHVRPDTLVHGLVAWLRDAGVRILEHSAITRVELLAPDSWRVRTADGASPSAQRLVVAAGPATLSIVAGHVDRRLRLLPAKGYSVTARGSGIAPRHATYLLEARVGCSPFEDGIRLAGTLELGVRDTIPGPRRVAVVARAAEQYFDSWRPDRGRVDWAGLRTLASDTLPLIGGVPGRPGLYIATGHGLLGVTLAPATAARLAALVIDGRAAPELRPFALDRWSRNRNAT